MIELTTKNQISFKKGWVIYVFNVEDLTLEFEEHIDYDSDVDLDEQVKLKIDRMGSGETMTYGYTNCDQWARIGGKFE